MNRNGRLIGGVLIGLALLLIARAVTTVPSGNQSSNQLNQNSGQNQTPDQAFAQTPPDRPLINDFNASRVSIAESNPGGRTGTQNLGTPGSGSNNVAQNSGNRAGSGSSSGASTRPAPPIVQGAW